ncbi:MAG: DNA repair protein RecO [Candidatus Shapirobacteria bacterium]|nr:DNA repair protein RecO [Candidatus Shapirobacteria bacterium]MDD4410478.1 DNA repair protein RecO [Candidatus Shapirobacteria bacterium]
MEKYQNTVGIVINKKTIKETDLLVTLLTPRNGKIVALAKGAKNIKSSRLSCLQLGNTIKVQLYQKNDYLWLSEAQTITPFLQHDKNLTQINLLFYFLEILNRLIAENQQIESIYQISQEIIDAINQNQLNRYIKSEILFLETLGFGVPTEINQYFAKKDYKTTQQLIKGFFESIIEKPLESNKLFK